MAINIKFDLSNNPELPTIILANRNGKKLGQLDSKGVVLKDTFNNISEITFTLNKYVDGKLCNLWEQVKDFKLIYCKEWDMWFEINVEINESDETIKTVSCVQLGQAELSQIILYDIEINTENDISRDDYEATVLFDELNAKASLLNRILEKAPHYSIAHVDYTIANIQRTFSFNDTSIYDALQEISEEIGCLFVFDSNSDANGNIKRTISVYDLQQYCISCGHRGEFIDTCPKCNSNDIKSGYGKDTTIFITSDELADSIQLSTDTGSVKNCFKLEAGDDLMTATIRNCNPNGTNYIWYFSDTIKDDMSDELVEKINEYNRQYEYYKNNHLVSFSEDEKTIISENKKSSFIVGVDVQVGDIIYFSTYTTSNISYITKSEEYNSFGFTSITGSEVIETFEVTEDIVEINVDENSIAYLITDGIIKQYNNLIDKYKIYNESLVNILPQLIGYSSVMNAYYNTIDLDLYLQSSLMPSIEMNDTNALEQSKLLTATALSPVAVTNINSVSLATSNNAVLTLAKIIVDSKYKVEVNTSTLSDLSDDGMTKNWTGNFIVTNHFDEEDTAISNTITITINADYESYVKQKLEKSLNANNTDDYSILGLFEKDYVEFCDELKKYSLNCLISFKDACQTCIDILIEQGVSDSSTWSSSEQNLYEDLYVPYYDKLKAIESEISVRENEIDIILSMQSCISEENNVIHDALNFEDYLGNDLWLEFCAYRREDKYSNDNYISDGLDNTELFKKALEFIEVAENEIYKSSELQHSISSTLKNLLSIKKFKPLVQYFEVGNWIRIQIDNQIYKLRLLEYEIDYDNFDNISVTFSDVMKIKNGITDVEDILSQASSMATSYSSVQRQAEQGKSSKNQLNSWINDGLALTNMKIIGNANNQNVTWDSHGILCREYLPITDSFDDRQLKIINRGLYITNDNWKTSKAGIGNFIFYNPETGETEEAYGVIADTLVGNLILSEKVGIYNTESSVIIDKSGISITSDNTSENNSTSFTLQKKVLDENGNEIIVPIFYVDTEGDLVLNGSIKIVSNSNENISSIDDICDDNRLNEAINTTVNSQINTVYKTIDEKYTSILNESITQLDNYKADIGQYLSYGEDGLTLGASSSAFKTVIDNQRLAFKENATTVAYISNSQLNILNAIIRNSLILGKFFFSPRADQGVSITWQEDISVANEEE